MDELDVFGEDVEVITLDPAALFNEVSLDLTSAPSDDRLAQVRQTILSWDESAWLNPESVSVPVDVIEMAPVSDDVTAGETSSEAPAPRRGFMASLFRRH